MTADIQHVKDWISDNLPTFVDYILLKKRVKESSKHMSKLTKKYTAIRVYNTGNIPLVFE